MAKKKIQFQKSVSIHKFIKAVRIEVQCLARLCWPDGLRCPNNSGHDKYCKLIRVMEEWSDKHPFVTDVAFKKKGRPVAMHQRAAAGLSSKELTQWALRHIQAKLFTISDDLACFKRVRAVGSFICIL